MPSSAPETAAPRKTDTLTSGIAFMMALTVAQRGVGFVRTALFCRLLPEEELGQWSLIFSFVMLAAPLTMLGITGSFGRYVEHYLQRGLARAFFRRTGIAVATLASVVVAGMWFQRDWVSWSLFGNPNQTSLLLPAGITLLITILYNYCLEMVIALRRIKVGSTMELISSWTFAFLGVTLLKCTSLGSYGVVLSYAAGNLLGACYALLVLRGVWGELPQSNEAFPHVRLWRKLAPFALGLWFMNIVANLFDMVDRYMIVHFSGIPSIEAQGMVGQYFSSMAVPLLMVGVSGTLAHLVMPYLSEDWEAGRKQAVSDRINLSLKLIGLMLSIASVSVVLVGPLLFGVIFGGKYEAGYSVLPFTIAFCFWKGIACPTDNYLFCIERTRLMCVAMACGLVANVVLNAILLPRLGLAGAAVATATGCALNVVLGLYFATRHGFRLHRGSLWVLLFPFSVGFGPTVAAIALILLLWVACCTTWFLSAAEREQLDVILRGFAAKALPSRFSIEAAHSGG